MAGNQDMRASDADRQRVADALRRHTGDGRLTLDELAERLEETYSARTLGQLEGSASPLRELPPLVPPLSSPTSWVAPPPPPYPAAATHAARYPAWTRAPRMWVLAVAAFILIAIASHGMAGAAVLFWVLFVVALRLFKKGSAPGRGQSWRSYHHHW